MRLLPAQIVLDLVEVVNDLRRQLRLRAYAVDFGQQRLQREAAMEHDPDVQVLLYFPKRTLGNSSTLGE